MASSAHARREVWSQRADAGEPGAHPVVEIAAIKEGSVIHVAHLDRPHYVRLGRAVGLALQVAAGVILVVGPIARWWPGCLWLAGFCFLTGRLLLALLRRAPAFRVGAVAGADLPLGGSAAWPLVAWDGEAFIFTVPGGARVACNAADRDGWEFLEPGRRVALRPGTRIRASWLGHEFLIGSVPSPTDLRHGWPALVRRLGLIWLGVPALVIGGCLFLVGGMSAAQRMPTRYYPVHAYPLGVATMPARDTCAPPTFVDGVLLVDPSVLGTEGQSCTEATD